MTLTSPPTSQFLSSTMTNPQILCPLPDYLANYIIKYQNKGKNETVTLNAEQLCHQKGIKMESYQFYNTTLEFVDCH